MINHQLDHPDEAKLQAFALGKVAVDEVDVIQSHLKECSSCCKVLDDVQDDTFVALVRDAETVMNLESIERRIEANKEPGEVKSVGETQEAATKPAEAPTIPPSVHPDTESAGVAELRAAAITEITGELVTPPAFVDHPRFHVLEMIGQGGMGAVYRAEHRHMKRQVALKVINPKLVAGKSAVERFRREVEAAARLHHPNIVTAHDAELAGEIHFLVMEYVQGTDLHEVLQKRGPLPVAEACNYIRQAAMGLQHAMENGMVHRDIKPQNLMLTDDGKVKILDFGLASLSSEVVDSDTIGDGNDSAENGTENLRSSLTQAGSIMGTPDYMAPEQARDASSADIRADIYSLGCTFYTLLSGKAPFPGGTTIDKIVAHSERTPAPVDDSRDDLPKGLSEVLARMLAKDAAERFQTPAEVVEALQPFTQPEASPKRSHTRRLVWTALVASALFLLGGVIWVTTDNGDLKIDSKVDDVQIVISQGGKEVEVIDLKTATTVTRLPSGNYKIALKGKRNDVKLSKGGFTISRWGKTIVTVTAAPAAAAVDSAEFTLVVRAGRGKLSKQEEQKLQSQNHQLLFQLAHPPTKKIIELFANLPDSLHKHLLKQGYLKWKFTSLDAARQKVYLEILKANLEMTKKQGVKPPASMSLDALKKGDVGFAVVDIPEFKTKVVSWYILLPKHPQPIWVTVVGVKSAGKQPYFVAHHKQLPALRAKKYSKAITESGTVRQNWRQLFNGKDLTGWRRVGGTPATWKVDNRLLRGAGSAGYLVGDKNYGEFHLRTEARINPGASWGLRFHTDPKSLGRKNQKPHGFGVEFVYRGKTGDVAGHLRMAITFTKDGVPMAKNIVNVKPNDWVAIEVIVRGGRVDIKVPGGGLGGSKLTPKLPPGPIIFHLVGKNSAIEFKKIEIKELSAVKPDLVALTKVADAWLKLMDDGRYGECWEQSAAPNRKGISKADMITLYRKMAAKFGKVTSRKRFSRDFMTFLPGFPKGRYVLIKYETDFEKQKGLIQSVLLVPAKDGTWKVQAHVLVPRNPLAAPKQQAQPTDYDRLTGTWGPIKATFSGKPLTKEQLQQTRFEFDGDRVEISFPKSPTLKTRYALRQTQKPKWIEFVNPSTKKNKEPNIAGIYEFDGDKLKIAFGDADHARPRDFKPVKRQDHFVGTFVRTDRPKTAELRILDRYTGSWESKLTENPTQQFTRKVTSRHRVRNIWTLGVRFQQSYITSVENDEEWLVVRSWDKARGAYRHFLFGSTGSFFERRSQWDAETATMKYTIVPPAPGVTGTATDRFVDRSTMTSTLRVKNARGVLTRNVDGVAHRTAMPAPAELKVATGPAGVKELAVLRRMAGRWSVRHEMKPSVFNRRAVTQQLTETGDWILGGRFLRGRTYSKSGRLTAMTVMTWDKRLKAFRIWHFESNGNVGLWRATWDEKTRTTHWRALDTPPGWIGTAGSVQFVNDDKSIMSIRIKDAQNRVLLDVRQVRTRMKSNR